MINKIFSVFFSLLILLFFSINSQALNIDEYNDDLYKSIGSDELWDYLDDESKDYLNKIGLNSINANEIMNLSLKSVLEVLVGIFKAKWKEPFKALISATGTAIILTISVSFVPDDEKNRSVISMVATSFTVLLFFKPIYETIRACVSCVKICIGFEKILIPVLTSLLTISGKTASAISYYGASFIIAEIVSFISESVVLPAVAVSGALYLCSGMVTEIKLTPVADVIRKTISYILSISAATFSGTIAIKNIVASSSDSIGAKAIKLVSSTFIPIVGGALGEAFGSFTESFSLIRNTVGIFGIIALFLICVPVLIQTLSWIFSMRIASSLSEMLGCQCCVNVYNGMAYLCSMMNTLLIFLLAVFIVSTATVFIIGG